MLASRLKEFIPEVEDGSRYFEPFLGAASLFLALRPKKAVLSDLNGHLVDCYKWIKREPVRIAAALQRHLKSHSKEHYYRVRSRYNVSSPGAAQAARFIYLNAACFNGVFRVNRAGQFNVPFGRRPRLQVPTRPELLAISKILRSAALREADYKDALAAAHAGDFVYMDPPYPPLNGTSFFTHYTQDRFVQEDQEELARLYWKLSTRGCLIMMTNADTPSIRELYSGSYLTPISVPRYVTCKSKKHRVQELVITNYEPPAPLKQVRQTRRES